MKKVLILNVSAVENNELYSYGKTLYNGLKECKHIQYEYNQTSNYIEYLELLLNNSYDAILYNITSQGIDWLSKIHHHQQNIGIIHPDIHNVESIFDKIVKTNPSNTDVEEKNTYFTSTKLLSNELIARFDEIINSPITCSQAFQDMFGLVISNLKTNGTFVDLGANHPSYHNNTFVMENKYGWRGLLVEYERSFLPLYKTDRLNSMTVIGDATILNYASLLELGNFPSIIDYLSIDLDVDNRSTLSTLERFDAEIFPHYKFRAITFEHDIYTGNFFDTRQLSRNIFQKHGYILVFPDVHIFYDNRVCQFEDWYVHSELVDHNIIQKLQSETSISASDIRRKLLQIIM